MKAEIHYRPLMMPYVRGEESSQHPYEADLWIYPQDGVGQVLVEYVVKDHASVVQFIDELKKALQNVEIVFEAE